ncbi:TPA: hypothetical protein U1C43_001793 [Streptococcus suis]|nr:hypothetical protein [Streptococcus suis]
MDTVTTVITALGVAGTVRGLFAVWSGWEEYSVGKVERDTQRETRGKDGMIYGGMMAVGAASIAAAIVAAMTGFNFG